MNFTFKSVFNTVSDIVKAQGLQIPVQGWPMDQMPHTVFRRYGQLETLAACTYRAEQT